MAWNITFFIEITDNSMDRWTIALVLGIHLGILYYIVLEWKHFGWKENLVAMWDFLKLEGVTHGLWYLCFLSVSILNTWAYHWDTLNLVLFNSVTSSSIHIVELGNYATKMYQKLILLLIDDLCLKLKTHALQYVFEHHEKLGKMQHNHLTKLKTSKIESIYFKTITLSWGPLSLCFGGFH